MRILVLNAGSSSLKFGIFDVTLRDARIFKGEFESFTSEGSRFHWRVGGVRGRSHNRPDSCLTVEQAIRQVPQVLTEFGFSEFAAIGHRVVHGGDGFQEAAIIDRDVFQRIQQAIPLAPLHNPENLRAIALCQDLWPDKPNVAVFDTGFHQTIPEYAHTYAIPEDWRRLGVRRYGFHGTSHKYIGIRWARALDREVTESRIISCHLGNGASLCAIFQGRSVDTSMGMTPLEGVVMGTRSGDVDPGMFAYLWRQTGLAPDEIENQLYHDSGLKAISGYSDMRSLEKYASQGDRGAILAVQIFVYRIRKYIAAYASLMSGADAVVFTGGIGTNSAFVRAEVCAGLEFMGMRLDSDKNATMAVAGSEAVDISTRDSPTRIIVTRTQEQYMIAKETQQILEDRPLQMG